MKRSVTALLAFTLISVVSLDIFASFSRIGRKSHGHRVQLPSLRLCRSHAEGSGTLVNSAFNCPSHRHVFSARRMQSVGLHASSRRASSLGALREPGLDHRGDDQVVDAVVLGASIAGLLTARVLSGLGWRVTILEKDCLQEVPNRETLVDQASDSKHNEVKQRLRGRAGTPQARHIHTLLPAGASALGALFPGILEELVEAGGREVALESSMKINIGGLSFGPASRTRPAPPSTVLVSRSLIEETLRRRVTELEGVTIRSGTNVHGLIGSGGDVRGVLLRHGEKLLSSLVVDATGRGSRCGKWIAKVGGELPETEVVDCKVIYADALMRPAPEDAESRGWNVFKADHLPGQGRRGGIIYEIEHGLWLVGLSGCLGERPPRTRDDWLKYAKGLPDLEFFRFLERAEFLSPVHHIAATANIRRYWESTSPLAGFIAVGDALCAPNPLYGQGMTMASLQALALHRVLRRTKFVTNGEPLSARTTAALQDACAKAVDAPWELASGTDDFRLQLENNGPLMIGLKAFWLIVSSIRGVFASLSDIIQVMPRDSRISESSREEAPQMAESSGSSATAAATAESKIADGAVVACTCGKTRLTLSTRVPRLRLECCCADCRQALEWAASKGGPVPPAVPQWHYFENDIQSVQGLENLELFTLRSGACVTRAVATCCHSTLLANHPVYQGNVFAVPGDVCQLCAKHVPSRARIWTKDRDGDKEVLPPYSGEGPCLRGDEGFWPFELMLAFMQPVQLPRKGISLQQLCARLRPPGTLGLQGGRRFSLHDNVKDSPSQS